MWILCGDRESAECSVWEALSMAARHGLAHVSVIVDVNRMRLAGTDQHGLGPRRVRAQDQGRRLSRHRDRRPRLSEIDEALKSASSSLEPTVIVARTRKGRGFHEIEDKEGWHGKALPTEMAERAIHELGGIYDLAVVGPRTEPREAIAQVAHEDGAPHQGAYRKAHRGEAVLSALAAEGIQVRFGHLAVRTVPDSREPAEELDAAGLSAGHIAAAAKRLLTRYETPARCVETVADGEGTDAPTSSGT